MIYPVDSPIYQQYCHAKGKDLVAKNKARTRSRQHHCSTSLLIGEVPPTARDNARCAPSVFAERRARLQLPWHDPMLMFKCINHSWQQHDGIVDQANVMLSPPRVTQWPPRLQSVGVGCCRPSSLL